MGSVAGDDVARDGERSVVVRIAAHCGDVLSVFGPIHRLSREEGFYQDAVDNVYKSINLGVIE